MKAKKKRNLILMIAVMVLLVGVFIALQISNQQETVETETEESGRLLTSLKESQITAISYQYEDGEKLNYAYVDDTWKNADDSEFPLSSSAFASNFVETFITLETTQEIDDAGNESAYGFDNPYLTVWVSSSTGTEQIYYVGSYNTMLQAYYLKIEGDDKIYTIGTSLLYICRADMYDYASMETFPSYSTDTLTDITIRNHGVEIVLAYYEDGYETDLIGQCKWFFGTPFSFLRSAETNNIDDLQSDVFNSVQFSKLANYHPTQEDLENYGLTGNDRQYIIHDTITDEDSGITYKRSQIVNFGNYDEDSDCYYARMTVITGNTQNVSDNVYLVSKSSVDTLLGIDPLNYIYKQVVYVKLTDVADDDTSNIVFDTPDGEYTLVNKTTFREDGTEEENIYYINGELMNESDVEDFYFEILANCGIEQIIYDRSTIVEDVEPTYTITYNRNKEEYTDSFYGNQIVVTYTLYNANYYQVSINGYTDILVNKRVMDESMALLTEMQPAE